VLPKDAAEEQRVFLQSDLALREREGKLKKATTSGEKAFAELQEIEIEQIASSSNKTQPLWKISRRFGAAQTTSRKERGRLTRQELPGYQRSKP